MLPELSVTLYLTSYVPYILLSIECSTVILSVISPSTLSIALTSFNKSASLPQFNKSFVSPSIVISGFSVSNSLTIKLTQYVTTTFSSAIRLTST